MKLLQSSRIPLPIVYLVADKNELDLLPMGIPFIIGDEAYYNYYVELFELKVLYDSFKKTGLSMDWNGLLKDKGFNINPVGPAKSSDCTSTSEYIEPTSVLKDTSYIIEFEVIKNLGLLPTWFTDIENAIQENILNSVTYNPNLYTKKLGFVAGDVELNSPEKNLIIIDISGSIPRSISTNMLLLSKTMATLFYADLLITGSKTTLYEYNEVGLLNVEKIYKENGTDNDQLGFIKLISTYRKYNNVISFGDDDYPGYNWFNQYNNGTRKITVSEGKAINKWQVNKVYSFHTHEKLRETGYTQWFDRTTIEHKQDWTKYLN